MDEQHASNKGSRPQVRPWRNVPIFFFRYFSLLILLLSAIHFLTVGFAWLDQPYWGMGQRSGLYFVSQLTVAFALPLIEFSVGGILFMLSEIALRLDRP